MEFRHAARDMTVGNQLDDAPDLTSENGTLRDAMDDRGRHDLYGCAAIPAP